MAVINFVSLLGWAPSDGQELFYSMKDIYRSVCLLWLFDLFVLSFDGIYLICARQL
jgi:hypothetical protein